MTSRAPLVSVVIPTYNRSRYLGGTIDSVLAQDHPAVEVIVVDDGSADDTPGVLARYAGKVAAIRQPNSGQGVAVNRGLAASRGEYLTLVSDDDPLLPGALSTLVDVLETRLDALVAYPDWLIIDPAGVRVARITGFEYSLDDMVRDHLCYPGPCALFRRKALELAGGWDTRWRWVADYDFWLRIGLHGPMVHVPETLATWRRHPEAATVAAPRLAMAREQVNVIEEFFRRDDLPASLREAERDAMASAWSVGAAVALAGPCENGLPRFQLSDRLSTYVERPVSASWSAGSRPRESRTVEQLEVAVATLERERAALQRHVEVLERHLRLLGAAAPGEPRK